MTFNPRARIWETCNSPGIGAVTLLGAHSGAYTTFSVIGNGNTIHYCIADRGQALFEEGYTTYSSGSNSLSRSAGNVTDGSSGAGVLVNFSSGVQDVIGTHPSKFAYGTGPVWGDGTTGITAVSASEIDFTLGGTLSAQLNAIVGGFGLSSGDVYFWGTGNNTWIYGDDTSLDVFVGAFNLLHGDSATSRISLGFVATNTADHQLMLGTASETVVMPGTASVATTTQNGGQFTVVQSGAIAGHSALSLQTLKQQPIESPWLEMHDSTGEVDFVFSNAGAFFARAYMVLGGINLGSISNSGVSIPSYDWLGGVTDYANTPGTTLPTNLTVISDVGTGGPTVCVKNAYSTDFLVGIDGGNYFRSSLTADGGWWSGPVTNAGGESTQGQRNNLDTGIDRLSESAWQLSNGFLGGHMLTLAAGGLIGSTIPGSVATVSYTSTGGTITITTDTDHGLVAGQWITISGMTTAALNGTWQIPPTPANGVRAIPTATKFRIFSGGFADHASPVADATGTVQARDTIRLVQEPTTYDPLADVIISPSAAGRKPLVVQGLSSQTASLFEVQNYLGQYVLQVLAQSGPLTCIKIDHSGNGNTMATIGQISAVSPSIFGIQLRKDARYGWSSQTYSEDHPDTCLLRLAPGVVGVDEGSGTAKWIQNSAGHLMANTSPTNATNTLASTNLAWALAAGRSYSIKGKISGGNSTAAEGIQFALTASGGLTATTFDLQVIGTNGTVVAVATRVTALGTAIDYSTFTATSDIYFTGEIKCGVAGVMTLQFAESTIHAAGTVTLNAGSWVEVNDCVAV